MTAPIHPLLILALFTGPSSRNAWRPPELAVKAPPPLEKFEEVKEIALQYLGRPYVMGGVGSPGFDCSGFVCRVYAESGYAIPRVSRDQARHGLEVPLEAIAPGDLLFFAENGRVVHVGMYLGNGELAHASTGQGKVVVANLEARWFQKRLVGARRILTGTSSVASGPTVTVAETNELVEHQGETFLLPMLRRPSRLPTPSFGPELVGAGVTSVGVRGAFVSDDGAMGFTLAPEATLEVPSVALTVAVAVPIRFGFDGAPTLGELDSAGDYTRFLRHVSLGVEDADLELKLSRFGDVSLLGGYVVDHVAPAVTTRGIPGLTVDRSPLTFFGRTRFEYLEAEAFVDDVVSPGLFGAAVRVPVPVVPVSIGAGFASDQAGRNEVGTRTVNAAEVSANAELVDTSDWSVDVHVDLGALRALDEQGLGFTLALDGELRLGAAAVALEIDAGYAGSDFLPGFFGPTYGHERRAHLEALGALGGRTVLGSALALRYGKLSVKAQYGQGIGSNRAPIDQHLLAVIEAESLSWFGTNLIDLRFVYAARAPFAPEPTLDAVHGNVRVRLFSWLFAEGYVMKGRAFEAGAGVTIAWLP